MQLANIIIMSVLLVLILSLFVVNLIKYRAIIKMLKEQKGNTKQRNNGSDTINS